MYNLSIRDIDIWFRFHTGVDTMKNIGLLLCFSTLSFALEAPYLISANALSYYSVLLQWRNTDFATQGYIIQRADSIGVDFTTIDSIDSVSTVSVVDRNGLDPLTLYTYRLFAYNGDTVSESSNTVQVRTLTGILFQTPTLSVSWDIFDPVAIQVSLSDRSNCESGYRIWRAENGSNNFTSIADFPSIDPSHLGSGISLHDSSISINKWYTYKVEVYRSDSSIFSYNASCFTLKPENSKQIIRFNKVNEQPLTLSGWSARTGDSIILKERNTEKYSVFNIRDKKVPRFDGYIDSSILISSSFASVIPAHLKFNIGKDCGFPNQKIFQKGDQIIYQTTMSVYLYSNVQNNLELLSAVSLPQSDSPRVVYNIYFNSDSLIAFLLPSCI